MAGPAARHMAIAGAMTLVAIGQRCGRSLPSRPAAARRNRFCRSFIALRPCGCAPPRSAGLPVRSCRPPRRPRPWWLGREKRDDRRYRSGPSSPPFDTLPMATRAVFLLHRIDGLRYAEIGWRLGIGRARVMVHMARALYVLTWGPNGDE